jgi:hypothetical protein
MAGRKLAGTLIAAAMAFGLAAAPSALAQVPMTGSPLKAEVRFSSLLGLPPEAYSLVCVPSMENCTTSGNIDLATASNVQVLRSGAVGPTRGAAPLGYTSATGEVQRTFTCSGIEPGTFISRYVQESTQPGSLEISDVNATPGANTLDVALNHGGVSGNELPLEDVFTSAGGCGSPIDERDIQMGQWYAHFYQAHRGEQQDIGNDLVLDGLAYENGAFAKTYERFVQVGDGSNRYLVFENTRVEVVPEFCRGKRNQVVSATAGGESLGLDGSSFYDGQVISAPPKSKIRLGDGSIIEMEKGGKYEMGRCQEDLTEVYLGDTIKSFLVNIKKAAAGSDEKFNVTTARAATGARGTVFDVSYDAEKQLTRVEVDESSVSLKGINGAKGKVIVKAGQVGVQKGKKAPRIVRG